MPQNLWNDTEAQQLPDLDYLVYRSNLLGHDRAVVNIYGGNTSAKLTRKDHMGRAIDVLAVKASGSDVATITEPQFALLRMDDIQPLFEYEAMTDEEMVAYLGHTVFEPGRPRQSIETLLHAFVPYKHVDHTHPDAIISLACAPDAEAVARDVYGERMAFVPYIRPGFTLSKWIGQKVVENPDIECVVMGKHGLVTWSDDPRQCYDNSIRIIQEAEDYIAEKRRGKRVFGDMAIPTFDDTQREAALTEILPIIRGAVSSRRHMILQTDDSAMVMDMVSSINSPTISQEGVACPDHLVHTKRQPLFIQWSSDEAVDALKSKVRDGIADFEARYVEYFETNKVEGDELRDSAPRVILIPGLGMVNTGKDATNADVSRQLYHRAIEVLGGSEVLGGFNALTPKEAYDIEYWPLELYKLKLKPPDRQFAGKVALVSGAASGIGRAIAYRLAEDGAHVVIADINADDGQAVAEQIVERYGHQRAIFSHCDVTKEVAVQETFRQTVLTYGGLDILVNNAGIAGGAPIEETSLAEWQRNMDILATGYFLMAREAVKVMKAQGIGGVLIFVGSKNSIAPAKGATAYGAAKAAEIHLARSLAEEVGKEGIRVNSVLPDGVIRGSSIWDSDWKEARAKQYGISVDEINEHYRQRNVLKVEILPEDIAHAVAFLAGSQSSKTTGAVLTVDGGVSGAYVR